MESLEEVQSEAQDPICGVARQVNTESLEEVQSEAQDPICGVARLVNMESLEPKVQDFRYMMVPKCESEAKLRLSEKNIQRHDLYSIFHFTMLIYYFVCLLYALVWMHA